MRDSSSSMTRVVRRWVLSTLVYSISIVLAFLLSRTFLTPPPANPADVVILVNNTSSGPLLTEVRKYVGINTDLFGVTRVLYQESDTTNYFVTGGGMFRSMVGEFPVLDIYRLPDWVSGRWCSKVVLAYWPSYSLREHLVDLPPVCFETTEYE